MTEGAMKTVGIEDVRAFWDRRPCNIRHSPKVVGSVEFCREVGERRYFVEPHISAFADFPRWKGRKVLEVGCGIGTDSARFVQAGAQFTGAELSAESLSVCKRCFSALKLTGNFHVVDAEKLSSAVPVERYDLVYSFGVIHHSPQPENIIQEIKKYMGPESELRIMLYAKYSWKSLMILFGFDQPEAQTGCPIAKTYSAKDVRKLLRDFEVISITKDHIFPYSIPEYREYRYVKTPLWRYMPETLFYLLKRYLGWHLLIRARLKPRS
jgi:2-polyprenyl-3-methyl-5-hydroxy-6-metoxy-1,4-benzoquinol methylase